MDFNGVVNNLMLSCKYNINGCTLMLSSLEKADHEEVCPFRHYRCPNPWPFCSWNGPLDKVIEHLQQCHEEIKIVSDGNTCVGLGTYWLNKYIVRKIAGHNFMLVVEKQTLDEGHIRYFIVDQLIGSREQAERFRSRLEITGNYRRFIWETMIRSSEDGAISAFLQSDCMILDTSFLQNFGEALKLDVSVTSV